MTDETELRDLERRLAYLEATITLNSECAVVDGWTHTKTHDPGATKSVSESVRYLDLRGLLERKPDAPHLVRVKEEQ